MTPKDIKTAFDMYAKGNLDSWTKSGAASCLNKISKMIHDMQNLGIEINIKIATVPTPHSFDLISDRKTAVVPVSGYIKIGAAEHLFAFADTLDDQDANTMFISLRDSSKSATGGNDMVKNFDLKTNSGLNDFQDLLIELAARHEALVQCDPYNVFNKVPEPKKMVRPLNLPTGRVR